MTRNPTALRRLVNILRANANQSTVRCPVDPLALLAVLKQEERKLRAQGYDGAGRAA
jgi:hypothetical protein